MARPTKMTDEKIRQLNVFKNMGLMASEVNYICGFSFNKQEGNKAVLRGKR